ncbi:hypothetical protein [Pararhodospirillum oryzae]|uniref:Uncharacterized protein n=1 Tax=Pararhodospirillum oryzae TaxID=478448 RepID=A0A512H6T7_9PROT|nr:hypothetical protein [Pararhodospirillum oryzae]GEO81141.1 hypothetical protein ROR02_12720 [Pararhodospirillum oryzae]
MTLDQSNSAAVIRKALVRLGRTRPQGQGCDAAAVRQHHRVLCVLRALRPDLSLRQVEALLVEGADGMVPHA